MPDRGFQFGGRMRSFAHAFRGVRTMLRTQHNAWIHAAATVAVCAVVVGALVLGPALAERLP